MPHNLALQLNEHDRLPKLLPIFKAAFSADHEIGLYIGTYFLAGAALTVALPHCCVNGDAFLWPHFLLCYFSFVLFVTFLQLAIAFTHRERHLGRTANLGSSTKFVLGHIVLFLSVSVIRFILDWLMVAAVVLATAGLSGIRTKNIFGAAAGVLLFAISWALFLILDNAAGILIRFGIPTAVYFDNKSIMSVRAIAADIFKRKTRDAFLAEFTNEWLILAVIAIILITLPIIDMINNRITTPVVVTFLGVLISLIYFVKLAFTLVYCQVVSQSQEYVCKK